MWKYLILFFFICTSRTYGQPSLQVTFANQYINECIGAKQCADGSYLIGGFTYLPQSDLASWIIRTDSMGNMLWQKRLNRSSFDDMATSLEPTSDNGCIIGGSTFSGIASGMNIFLLKMDSTGAIEWSNSYGSPFHDYSSSVKSTLDGGYIVCGNGSMGNSAPGAVLLKTDSVGNIEWAYRYDAESAWSVEQTSDSGFVMGCRIQVTPGEYDIAAIKTDKLGNVLWANRYGGTTNSEIVAGITQDHTGGYVISALYYDLITFNDEIMLIRIDSAGNVVWARTGIGSYTVPVLMSDDGYYMVASNGIHLSKVDSSGNIVWTIQHGVFSGQESSSLQMANDGGYVVGGTNYDPQTSLKQFYLLKTDSLGHSCIDSTLALTVDTTLISVFPLTINPDSGCVMASINWSSSVEGTSQILCIDFPNGFADEIKSEFNFSIFPNPVNLEAGISFSLDQLQHVTIEIFDVSGRKQVLLCDQVFEDGEHLVTWDASLIPAGLYFVKMITGQEQVIRKISVAR